MIDRRLFLKASALLANYLSIPGVFAAQGNAVVDLKPMGKLAVHPMAGFRSPLYSIGLETLDRELYDFEAVVPTLRVLPVKYARIQSGWARCEKFRGVYDFAWLDNCVDSLIELGIEPWINLGYGNPVYMPEAKGRGAVGWNPLYAESAMQAWLKYVGAVTSRYKTRIRHFEIWNEPQFDHFWRNAKPNPKDYARFTLQTIEAIKREFPEAAIVAGTINLNKASLQFAETFLNEGLHKHIDILTYHHYPRVPETYYQGKIAEIRAMLARYPRPIVVWQGESGCPSSTASAGALSKYQWSEKLQAKWIARRLTVEAQMALERTSYFHLTDLMSRDKKGKVQGRINYKGLISGIDYKPKPGFHVFNLYVKLLSGLKPYSGDRSRIISRQPKEIEQFSFSASANQLDMFCFWRKGEFDADDAAQQATHTFSIQNATQDNFSNLTVLDPLTLEVFTINSSASTVTLPIRDYPLLLLSQNTLTQLGDIKAS